jgi:hypothetical protein
MGDRAEPANQYTTVKINDKTLKTTIFNSEISAFRPASRTNPSESQKQIATPSKMSQLGAMCRNGK